LGLLFKLVVLYRRPGTLFTCRLAKKTIRPHRLFGFRADRSIPGLVYSHFLSDGRIERDSERERSITRPSHLIHPYTQEITLTGHGNKREQGDTQVGLLGRGKTPGSLDFPLGTPWKGKKPGEVDGTVAFPHSLPPFICLLALARARVTNLVDNDRDHRSDSRQTASERSHSDAGSAGTVRFFTFIYHTSAQPLLLAATSVNAERRASVRVGLPFRLLAST